MKKDEAREAARESAYRERICRAESDEALAFGMFDAGYEFANKWNVIERDGLTFTEGWYLVTYEDDDGVQVAPAEMTLTYPPEQPQFSTVFGFALSATEVIAWRPLPEPYKGE